MTVLAHYPKHLNQFRLLLVLSVFTLGAHAGLKAASDTRRNSLLRGADLIKSTLCAACVLSIYCDNY